MKKGFAYFTVLIAMVLSATTSSAAGPRSIFDDDWTPPKASETPRPKPVAPPTVNPVTPTADPTSVKAPGTLRAIPARPEQAAVRKVMKEVYAEQIVDRSVVARRKLAETLLFQADKSAGTPVDQFVLLAAAIDAAVDAGDLPLAFEATDRMSEGFEVDALALKAETVGKVSPKNVSPESAAANVDAGLELISQLVAADDYAVGARLGGTMQTLTGGDAELRARVQQKQREVNAARDARERVARDMKKLEASPEDPSANLAVGRYLCFVKGDLARGLPLLSKGSDAAMKALAGQELAGVSADDALIRVADGWWDVAGKQDAVSRAGIMNHAAALYSQSVKQLDGLRRVQIEKRIAEARNASASAPGKMVGGKRVIDLLRLIDPKRDGVHGDWKLEPVGLTCDKQDTMRIAIPYDPPNEYDLHVAFTRHESKEYVFMIVSGNGHTARLGFWGEKLNWGMNRVDGKELWSNPTTGKREAPFKNGQRYDCVIQVRKDSVAAFLDGKQLFSLKTDFTNLDDDGHWDIRGAKLGVAAHQNSVTFHTIEILEVSGSGKSTVPAKR